MTRSDWQTVQQRAEQLLELPAPARPAPRSPNAYSRVETILDNYADSDCLAGLTTATPPPPNAPPLWAVYLARFPKTPPNPPNRPSPPTPSPAEASGSPRRNQPTHHHPHRPRPILRRSHEPKQ